MRYFAEVFKEFVKLSSINIFDELLIKENSFLNLDMIWYVKFKIRVKGIGKTMGYPFMGSAIIK